jgi:hypothetical protein
MRAPGTRRTVLGQVIPPRRPWHGYKAVVSCPAALTGGPAVLACVCQAGVLGVDLTYDRSLATTVPAYASPAFTALVGSYGDMIKQPAILVMHDNTTVTQVARGESLAVVLRSFPPGREYAISVLGSTAKGHRSEKRLGSVTPLVGDGDSQVAWKVRRNQTLGHDYFVVATDVRTGEERYSRALAVVAKPLRRKLGPLVHRRV